MRNTASPQQSSRMVIILGMHRSGTSAFARGMQALGVYLGNNFLETQPDNPTGYWEDKNICELNERLLSLFGLKWTDASLIHQANWSQPAVESLIGEATKYMRTNFIDRPLWGFKDPRTIRLMPFWQLVIRRLQVDECYLIAIRNPLSVAASLFQRQAMDAVTAYRLWLAYFVPYFNRLSNRRFVVADYDLLMAQPQPQLERIARAVEIPLDEHAKAEVRIFAEDFLDSRLRHNFFSEHDFDSVYNLAPLTREAYLWLRRLATDQMPTNSSRFWSAWERSRRAAEAALSEPGKTG